MKITFTVKHWVQYPSQQRSARNQAHVFSGNSDTSSSSQHQPTDMASNAGRGISSSFHFLYLTRPPNSTYLSHLFTFLFQTELLHMFTWVIITCILDCLRSARSGKKEDAEELGLVGLSAAKSSSLPPSTGGKFRKFQHGFRPFGRSKHGKSHMSHDRTEISNYNSNVNTNMAESIRRRLQELVKKTGNTNCAECGKKSKFVVCKHSSIVLLFLLLL